MARQRTLHQERRLRALKQTKRIKNPFAVENWIEIHERRRRLRRRKRG